MTKPTTTPANKRQWVALVSLGLVTGFMLTKGIRPLIVAAMVIGSFFAGLMFDEYRPTITWGEVSPANKEK